MVEINSILENDNGEAKEYTKEEWIKYYRTYGSYDLSFDTVDKITEFFNEIFADINSLENKLNIEKTLFS